MTDFLGPHVYNKIGSLPVIASTYDITYITHPSSLKGVFKQLQSLHTHISHHHQLMCVETNCGIIVALASSLQFGDIYRPSKTTLAPVAKCSSILVHTPSNSEENQVNVTHSM